MTFGDRIEKQFRMEKPKRYKRQRRKKDQSRIRQQYKDEFDWFWPTVIAGTIVSGYLVYGIMSQF